MSFANQLKKLREANNVTQQELADHLNVSRTTIGGYETKNKEPNFDIIIKMASFFHVSIDYLITGHEVSDSPSPEALLLCSIFDNNTNVKKEELTRLVRYSSFLNELDMKRLNDYLELLLLQPHYEKNQNIL